MELTKLPDVTPPGLLPPPIVESPASQAGPILAVSQDALIELVLDIRTYRSRRQRMLAGEVLTSVDLREFISLQSRLRREGSTTGPGPYVIYECQTSAILYVGSGPMGMPVLVASLSGEGARITDKIILPPGQKVRLSFCVHRDGQLETVEFEGRIAHVSDGGVELAYVGGAHLHSQALPRPEAPSPAGFSA
jgi:hypothetical protein